MLFLAEVRSVRPGDGFTGSLPLLSSETFVDFSSSSSSSCFVRLEARDLERFKSVFGGLVGRGEPSYGCMPFSTSPLWSPISLLSCRHDRSGQTAQCHFKERTITCICYPPPGKFQTRLEITI